MKFVDEARVYVTAGQGGDGCVSFRREKFVPRGGPDGGDGGNGGSIFLSGKKELNTLFDLKIKPHYKAGAGKHGQGKQRRGKDGKDVFIPVPLGIVVFEQEQTKGEILHDRQTLLIAQGGKGGRGNAHFVSSITQTPRHAESGKKGEKKELLIVLKLISDIGLVGFPNSGKSTLLKALTNARPKIANYPFTTLNPNLGVIRTRSRNIVIADMPGIVEGAHRGKGLGLTFLRHIERTNLLIIVIDCTDPAPLEQYRKLLTEFSNYSKTLATKPRVIVFNKIDLLDKIEQYPLKETVFYVSALTGQNVQEIVDHLNS